MRDQAGAPLVGATIAIFDAMSRSEDPVRNALTDDSGRFTASVAPGRYVLRAVAVGFDVMEARALVAPNRETKIDSIALRRVNTLADRRPAADPYRDAVLGSRGQILHLDPDEQERRDEADARAFALTERSNATHGVVETFAATGPDANYRATNFAVARHTLGSNLLVTGQVGEGNAAPRRFEALTTTDLGDAHQLAVTFGYGELGPPSSPSRLGQYTVQATDSWQIARPLLLVYGMSYSRFSGTSSDDAVMPRLGLELAATPKTSVYARLTPAALTEVAHFDLETGEATFTAMPDGAAARPQRAAERAGVPLQDRSRRFEVGVGHIIDEHSNIEFMAFFDTASGHGVGLFAVPADGLGDDQFSTGELNGRTTGARVLYTRRFTPSLSGTIGYAAGRGLALGPGGLSSPDTLFTPSNFNLVAARLDADFDTGTHVSAVYRFSSRTVVFAIDPFAGRLTAYEPAASVTVTQSLPSFGFLPGQWQATLDVHNLFDARPQHDDDILLVADYSRLVRAGLSLRF